MYSTFNKTSTQPSMNNYVSTNKTDMLMNNAVNAVEGLEA